LYPEISLSPRTNREFTEDEGDPNKNEELSAEAKDSILIAEDNADLRDFMSSILKNDFTVFTASNGEEALHLAVQVVPNLVLTDLMMPKLDGVQLAEKLKADERTSHIPVILLTAKNDSQSRLQGLKTGADDYLTKPFSTEELLVRITNLIEQRKRLAERYRERILIPVSAPAESASMDEKFLQRMKEVIEANMSDFTFTVEEMAEKMNLSRTQLLRKVKALTGLSPTELIKDFRLKRAAYLIRKKTDTVTQISYAVGFNEQSYFSKCFKKHFGVSPTEYYNESSDAEKIER
jgi:YesN/AraC family two-component response regulator